MTSNFFSNRFSINAASILKLGYNNSIKLLTINVPYMHGHLSK